MLTRQYTNPKNWASLDELVMVLSDVHQTIVEFKRLEIDTPEWLEDAERDLTLEIRSYQRKVLSQKLKDAQRELDSMRPIDERRADLQAKVDELKRRTQ